MRVRASTAGWILDNSGRIRALETEGLKVESKKGVTGRAISRKSEISEKESKTGSDSATGLKRVWAKDAAQLPKKTDRISGKQLGITTNVFNIERRKMG